MALDKKIRSIGIDPGHGERDLGAVGNGLVEKDLNMRLAAELFSAGLKHGFNMQLLRPGDLGMSLEDRVKLANWLEVDVFLSVHHNGAESAEATGTETFYCPGSEAGEVLARSVQERMVDALNLADRGIRWGGGLYVLQATEMPAVLIKPFFVTNRRDAGRVRDEWYFSNLALSILSGLVSPYYEE
ncbi:MAG: N-acetylmuramoyl-L-alanine amidase [Halarsenatibacteraceae bacterium]